jgi:MATE family multidrug resistance protein
MDRPSAFAAGPAAWKLEIRESLRLATPVVTVHLGTMLMGTVDTMMLGHLSALGLAAGSLGNALTASTLWFGYGIVSALEPLVAQAFGAHDREAISAHLARGLVLAAAISVGLGLVLWQAGPIFELLGQNAEVTREASSFCRVSIPSILPFLIFGALRLGLQGMHIIRPAVWATVVGNLVNVGANYILIFGKLGAPALGVAGSAASTVLARWAMLLYLLIATRRHFAPYWRGFGRSAWARAGYGILLRIGIPIGIHNGLELLVFSAVAALMGTIGVAELAAHQIALNLAAVSFMLPLGIAGAASVRVGNGIGRGDMPGARRSAAVCLGLGVGVMTCFALLFAAFPGLLARLYSSDPRVIAVAVTLLPIAALFQVFDGIQVVSTGVLRGAAETAFAAAMALLGYWGLGLPLGWFLAYRAGLGPRGLWWGLAASLALVAILLVTRIAFRFRGDITRVEAA